MGRKIIKGKLEKQYVLALVEALLKLANTDDSPPNTVKVKWSSENQLYVTGEDEKGNKDQGVTLKTLEELIYENQSQLKKDTKSKYKTKEEYYSREKTRNAIHWLKNVELLVDKRSQKPIKKTNGEEFLATNSKYWKFILKLKHKNKTLEEHIEYVKEKLGISSNSGVDESARDADNTTQSINEITDSSKIWKAAKLLRSFDCVTQENNLKQKIVKDQWGVFPTKVEKNIESWFVWRLTKCLGDFENIKKISISIDWSVKADFNNFWKKFGEYIGEKDNLNSEIVTSKLIELCQTQPVMIVINRLENLSSNQNSPVCSQVQENMSTFCGHLSNSFQSNPIKNYKSRLVLFLVEKQTNFKNINQENLIDNFFRQQDIIKLKLTNLELTNFSKNEVEHWLCENSTELEKNYDVKKVIKMMDNDLSEDSHDLLEDICKYVFKLENGIADVEHYWKNFA